MTATMMSPSGLRSPSATAGKYLRQLGSTACVALLAAGCGTPGRAGNLDTSTVITEQELSRVDVATAYEAVQRLRPDFLRPRGAVSIRNQRASLPVVYVAGIRQGGPETLRNVRLGDVLEIHYLNSVDATTRYGTDHVGGAIIIILR
jgi:hypothetical protein